MGSVLDELIESISELEISKGSMVSRLNRKKENLAKEISKSSISEEQLTSLVKSIPLKEWKPLEYDSYRENEKFATNYFNSFRVEFGHERFPHVTVFSYKSDFSNFSSQLKNKDSIDLYKKLKEASSVGII